jgi:hypothetical protein
MTHVIASPKGDVCHEVVSNLHIYLRLLRRGAKPHSSQ